MNDTELKNAILALVGIGQAVEKDLEDKKISWAEALALGWKIVPAAITDFKNWAAIEAQFKAADQAVIEDIKDAVCAQLGITTSTYVDQKISAAIKVAVDIEAFFMIKKPVA
jgi:hypothetical protein